MIEGHLVKLTKLSLVCVKGTHQEGDMAIYWLQLILILNLKTNTHERGGTQTLAPDLPVW